MYVLKYSAGVYLKVYKDIRKTDNRRYHHTLFSSTWLSTLGGQDAQSRERDLHGDH